MSEKIVIFPRGSARRARLNRRAGRVRCEVSGRYLQMPTHANRFDGKTYLVVAVMTEGGDGTTRKLCDLHLLKEDLLDVLQDVPLEERPRD